MGALTWIEALKVWNEDKPTWCIPRKGTPGHREVLEIMAYGYHEPEEEEAPSGKKAPRKKKEPVVETEDEVYQKEKWKRLSNKKRIEYYKKVRKYGVPPHDYAKRGYEAWLKKTEAEE